MFGHPLSGREDAQKLLQVQQDACSVAGYFCTLAAESAWKPESLFNTFLHGLSEVVKDELTTRELPMDMDSLTAIQIDGWLREHRRERRSVPGHTHSSTAPTSPPRNLGSPRRLQHRVNSMSPEFPRISQRAVDSPSPKPTHTPLHAILLWGELSILFGCSLTLGPTRTLWMLPWCRSWESRHNPSPFPWMS